MEMQNNCAHTVREQLAAIQHSIWAHWMKYLFSVCVRNQDGSATIPADLVQRWMQQIITSYDELSEQEKDSDREQADKILATISDRE